MGKTRSRDEVHEKSGTTSETAHDFWEYLEAKATLTTRPRISRTRGERSVIVPASGHSCDRQGGGFGVDRKLSPDRSGKPAGIVTRGFPW
jgi:hypothetical protein